MAIDFQRAMFVITHKSIEEKIEADGYHYLLVGKHDVDMAFKDSSFENISAKNPYYCELTGLYWMWKNVDAEEIGLCHYRRFFCKRDAGVFNVLDIKALSELLKHGDIIMAKPIDLYMDYFTFYEKAQRNDALRECCKFLVSRDASYKKVVDSLLEGTTNHCYNMFYCKKEIMDQYCEWLFELLFTFEEKIDISEWTTQQQRVYGFLAEFLFNVWVAKKGLKVIDVDVAQAEAFPVPVSTDANVIPVTTLKKWGFRILPSVWPLLSKALVQKTKYVNVQEC